MMDTASGGYPAGDLRASDADRDRVLAELSEHFQAGRLTVEELDERSGRALQARTGSDLAVLLADLPPGPSRAAASPPAAPAPPASAGPRQSGLPMARIAVLAIVAAVAIAAVSGASHGHHSLAILAPVLIVVFIARRLAGGGWRR